LRKKIGFYLKRIILSLQIKEKNNSLLI